VRTSHPIINPLLGATVARWGALVLREDQPEFPMSPSQIAKAARLDTSALGTLPALLEANTDQERAPITFGWWAQTTCERVSKHFHLETLYRLDRVQDGSQARLVPSQFYGMSEAEARQYLTPRQAALLPKLPAGYRWIGPQLIENVPGLPRAVASAFSEDLLSPLALQRLAIARNIAVAVLRRRGAPALA
jgi:hypothetical protein